MSCWGCCYIGSNQTIACRLSGVGNAPQTLRPEFPTHAIPDEETLLFFESHE